MIVRALHRFCAMAERKQQLQTDAKNPANVRGTKCKDIVRMKATTARKSMEKMQSPGTEEKACQITAPAITVVAMDTW